MIADVLLTVKLKYSVMVVAIQTASSTGILKNLINVCERSHGRIAHHAGNLTVGEAVLLSALGRYGPVGAVCVVVFVVVFVDAGVFKKTGSVDEDRV